MGNVTAIEQTQPASASRAFGYQDWQYYLDCVAGPWSSGAADCNPTSGAARELLYDLAGNRTFDTSPAQSLFYEPNAATSGDTSELDEITVPLSTFVRDYTFDAAGYVSQIEDLNDTTPISSVDFTFDAAGQLSLMDHSANDSAELSYDGRGFLRYGSVGAFTELAPTYSSDGLLYSLLRDWSPLTPHERHNVLYFAGRPIAIWKKVGTNTATLVRIVTDHLGTPAASIQQAGTAVDWYGGFMPFGEDWQAGTGQDSLSKGIFLRLPGQWKDSIWSTSSSPLEVFYNVYRWYEPSVGRYLSEDLLRLVSDNAGPGMVPAGFSYARSLPTAFSDALGLHPMRQAALLDAGLGVLEACVDDLHARRQQAQALRFPGTQNDYLRHCVVACESAQGICGPVITRFAGIVNEGQGILIDLWHRQTGAFELEDLAMNEQGLACAETGANCSCEDCCSDSAPRFPLSVLGAIKRRLVPLLFR